MINNPLFLRKLILVLVLGFVFRLFIIFVLPVRTFERTIKRYHYAAVNMVEGRGYSHEKEPPYQPSFFKPPAYSIFLAGIYKVFGINIAAARIAQALLDTAACVLLAYLAYLFFNRAAAVYVLNLALLCPVTAVYTSLLNPESLTLFFMVCSLLFVFLAQKRQKTIFYFLSGLSSIIMAYCRPEFIVFVFFFGACLLWRAHRPVLKKLTAYILAVFIIAAPWTIRNYALTKKFMPLSGGASAAGLTLWYATLGEAANDKGSLDAYFKEHPDMSALQDAWYKTLFDDSANVQAGEKYDRMFMRMAIDKIKADPAGHVMMRFSKLPRVWLNLHADEYRFLNSTKLNLSRPAPSKIVSYLKNDPKEVVVLGFKYLLFGAAAFYIFMALYGIWRLRKNLLKYSLMLFPLVYAQIFFLLIHESPNYAVPYWPFIIFFAGIGLLSLTGGVSSLKEAR